MPPVNPPALTRRAVVAGTCGAACAAALSACSTYGAGGPAAAPAAVPAPAAPSAPSGSGSPPALASTSDIPVGGGAVFADQDIVITQPLAGEFRAFSATCTHQGCAVGDVSDGTINCPCHGTRFGIDDGAVVDGPADTPLPARDIEVTGEEIVLA